VVTSFATASPSATLPSLLDYFAAAERAEDGLEPGEVEVADDRVQILTVHAAKGLEWQVVAVPHLVNDVFPGKRKSSSWLRSVTSLPAELRGDAPDLPKLDVDRLNGLDRKELSEALGIHDEEFEARRLAEERRLFYVAVTRSERTLLLSGHWWGESGDRPKGPSDFLTETAEVVHGDRVGVIDEWCPTPDENAENPLADEVRSAEWPVDPLGPRREAVSEGAELVRTALSAVDSIEVDEDPDGWARDVDVLLAERAAAAQRREEVRLPDHLSVSQLVELAGDTDALARRLRRPLPYPPNPMTRRGTAFHAWLEHRFTSSALLDVDELPGAADDSAPMHEDLAELQKAFLEGSWADRTPHRVEVPFETQVEGIVLRGRMDAVFADPDGGWTVVDWKTGGVPNGDQIPSLSVQLAAYRLAWAELSKTPLEKVRAAFHYVRHDYTLRPADLRDAEGLRELITAVPKNPEMSTRSGGGA
jgi:DNA helicase II / ATP-dependent DNA helicase PcrA